MTRFDRLGKRLQARAGSRWRKNTLENAFGLTIQICPACRRFNPRPMGEPPRDTCHACRAALVWAGSPQDPRKEAQPWP